MGERRTLKAFTCGCAAVMHRGDCPVENRVEIEVVPASYARTLEGALRAEVMPTLRNLSEMFDREGRQVLASDLHRLHERVSAALEADRPAREDG